METIPLVPVDSLTITTLVDNTTDLLLLDQGPAKRHPSALFPKVPARFLEGGQTADLLRAEHGFSCLVTIEKAGRTTRILFDAGVTPDGLVENMRRLEISAARHRHHRAQPRPLGSHHGDGRARGRAAEPEPAGADPPRLLEPAQDRDPGPRSDGAAVDEPRRARGSGLRGHRAAAALVPPRRLAAGHRRGRPHHGLRAGLPRPRGLPGRALAPRPADPRRPGPHRERARPRPRRPHRLRALRASSTSCATRRS